MGGDFKIWGDELNTRYSRVADEEKKKVLSIYIGTLETYTRYYRVADEKRSLGDIAFLYSIKWATW